MDYKNKPPLEKEVTINEKSATRLPKTCALICTVSLRPTTASSVEQRANTFCGGNRRRACKSRNFSLSSAAFVDVQRHPTQSVCGSENKYFPFIAFYVNAAVSIWKELLSTTRLTTFFELTVKTHKDLLRWRDLSWVGGGS